MKDVISSLRMFVLSILVCSAAYPAVMLGFAAVCRAGFTRRQPHPPCGRHGRRLAIACAERSLAPSTSGHGRRPCDYDASATGGSNLSPTNPELTERAEEIIAPAGAAPATSLPADLVTAPAAALDPHITLAAARCKLRRVAAARRMSADECDQADCTNTPTPPRSWHWRANRSSMSWN